MTIKFVGATVTISAVLAHQPAWVLLSLALIFAVAWLGSTWLSDSETRRQRHFAKQTPEIRADLIERDRVKHSEEHPRRAIEDA